MSGVILNWVMMRGMSELEAVINRSVDQIAPDVVLQNQLDTIQSKLDCLIGAPYQQALMYLREGRSDRAREKLIEAMSLNELDLPATALYCSLIQPTLGTLALEYQENIIRKFGAHRTIVPPELIAWSGQYLARGGVLGPKDSLELLPNDETPDYYPTEVYCSGWNIAVKWEYKEPRSGFDRVLKMWKPRLIVYNWEGSRLLELEENSLSLLAVTGAYVVLDVDRQGVAIWNIERATRLSHQFSRADAQQIFLPVAPVVLDTGLRWPTERSASFGGMSVRVDSRQYRRTEGVSSGQYGGHSYVTFTRTSGKVVFERSGVERALDVTSSAET